MVHTHLATFLRGLGYCHHSAIHTELNINPIMSGIRIPAEMFTKLYSLATKMRIFFSDIQKCDVWIIYCCNKLLWLYTTFFRCGWGEKLWRIWFLFLTADAWVSGPVRAPQKFLLSQQFRYLMRCKKYLKKNFLSCLVSEIQLFV